MFNYKIGAGAIDGCFFFLIINVYYVLVNRL